MTSARPEGKRPHYIMVGRVSRPIAQLIAERYNHLNIFQSRFSTFGDGESSFEMFLDDKLDDHPFDQEFSQAEKERIMRGLKGAHVTIVHAISGQNSSSRAMSLLHCLKHLKKNCGVATITILAPHTAYTRQDRPFTKVVQRGDKFLSGPQENAVSCSIFAVQLREAGADRFIGVDFHSLDAEAVYKRVFSPGYIMDNSIGHLERMAQTALDRGNLDEAAFLRLKEDFQEVADTLRGTSPYKQEAQFVSSVDIVGDAIQDQFPLHQYAGQIVFGAPDGAQKQGDLGVARARNICASYYGKTFADTELSEHPYMFGINKVRLSPSETTIAEEGSYIDNVKGKIAFLIDDIAASGSTQRKAAEFLKQQGASKVIAYATAGVLTGDALKKFASDPHIDEFWISDTVPSVEEKLELLCNANVDVSKIRVVTSAVSIVKEIGRDHAAIDDNLVWAHETYNGRGTPEHHLSAKTSVVPMVTGKAVSATTMTGPVAA